MIVTAFLRALGQADDPRFRKVLLLGIGLTILLLFALYAIVFYIVGWLVGDSVTLPFIGQVTWVDSLAEWSSLVLMMGMSVFLMIPVAAAIVSMFLDQVAEAVEDVHYPQLPRVPAVPFMDGVIDGLGMLGVLIVANVLALVLYLVFAPLAPFIFYLMNGYLLGREYFTLVAMRRIGRANAKAARKRHIATVWAAGTLMAIPLSIPFLNLLVPIFGAATFTHIYHGLAEKDPRLISA
ncbi:CysZ-like protein [Marinibacterium anthonyi]|nr:CysZ-like protein [Marinibacterium anthonyi]